MPFRINIPYKVRTLPSLCVVLNMFLFIGVSLSTLVWAQTTTANWEGILRLEGFKLAGEPHVLLESATNHYSATVDTEGHFLFRNLATGVYALTVLSADQMYRS